MAPRKKKIPAPSDAAEAVQQPPTGRSWWIPALLFFLVYGVHSTSTQITSADSRFALYVTFSLLKHGDTNIEEYDPILAQNQFLGSEMVKGHRYNWYPIGASLLAVPVVWVLDGAARNLLGVDMEKLARTRWVFELERAVASFFVALCVLVVYGTARRRVATPYALLAALLFAFCTPAWSTASRAMWQHAPSMLMLALTLYLFVRAEQTPWIVQLAGLTLGFSYVCRPTNSLSILAFTVLVLVRHRKYFLHFAAWGALVALAFFAYNYSTYDHILPSYYRPESFRVNTGYYLGALAASLVSPGRGIFVYTPFLALVAVVIWRKLRRGTMSGLDWVLCGVAVAHLLVMNGTCSWRVWRSSWWGGHSYGPRLYTDLMPYAIYLLLPLLPECFRARWWRPTRLGMILALAAGWSFFVHYRGATEPATGLWNPFPVNVDDQPMRVWDWKDVPWMRGYGKTGNR